MWAPAGPTGGTGESRPPARVEVRRHAILEMPHIMVFINDPGNSTIPSAAGGEALYDFELMLGGGRVRGSRVSGAEAERLPAALDSMAGEIKYAMGDGNPSLAAAKRCWEGVKSGVSPEERERHPARFALVELVNIHDDAVTFEPIHRVITGTLSRGFIEEAAARLPRGKGQAVTVLAGDRELRFETGLPLGKLVGLTDELVSDWMAERGGNPDYIHGEAEARALVKKTSGAAVLLPRLEKTRLFDDIAQLGPYPKKSFSIGQAKDKRYYLECRSLI